MVKMYWLVYSARELEKDSVRKDTRWRLELLLSARLGRDNEPVMAGEQTRTSIWSLVR
jgi:hypothetical protein